MSMQPPLAFTWSDLVDSLARERGGLAELARCLVEVSPSLREADPMTVERGLRRLRRRENAEGDKYGRALLRAFGVPEDLVTWARWVGQYHGRLSDLPVPMRREQLRLWDRPPMSESPAAIWVHLGLAGLARRARDEAQLARRLELARLQAAAAPEARLELLLLDAVVASDSGGAPAALLEQASSLLQGCDPSERACYRARLLDQQAYSVARGWREHPERLEQALALYEAIVDAGPAFARFRRAHGRAWCLWRLGRAESASEADRAVRFAGDAGLLRFRCMALGLRGRILEGPEDLQRARGIAELLQDERLLASLG